MSPVDVDLGLAGTHVLITGGAGHIGSAVTSAFLSAGCKVTVLDISQVKLRNLEQNVAADVKAKLYPTQYTPVHLWCDEADTSDERQLLETWSRAEAVFGPVACCVALAALDLSMLKHHEGGIADMSLEQWERTIYANVTGTFLVARQWVRGLKKHQKESLEKASRTSSDRESAIHKLQSAYLPNRSLIIVGSESGLFGERTNPDYATSKSAVQHGLLASLKADIPKSLGPGARVNSIIPGPVNTPQFRLECKQDPSIYYQDTIATVALGRPVEMSSVARSIVFLASERFSRNVHGATLRVDSGKEGNLMWKETE